MELLKVILAGLLLVFAIYARKELKALYVCIIEKDYISIGELRRVMAMRRKFGKAI